MADHRADSPKLQLPRPVLYFSISKSMKGKTWFPGLDSIAAQYVRVGRFGSTQRSDSQLAVFQNFGMPQRNPVASGPPDGQAQSANQVLTKIEDRTPGR